VRKTTRLSLARATRPLSVAHFHGCRWRGFAKNAHEALGSPRLIGMATLLLVGGQILPPFLLILACLQIPRSPLAIMFSLFGVVAVFLPRLFAVVRFGQPLASVLLHPLGVGALVAIQWFAFARSLRQAPAVWKGRTYSRAQPAQ
jgi:hypothetical protein